MKSRAATGSISRAQPIDRIAVDARQQPPVAPLLLVGARIVAPAHHGAVGLQRDQRGVDGLRRDAEVAASVEAATGPEPSSRPRKISASAFSGVQAKRFSSAGGEMCGMTGASGQRARNCGQPLGGDPERRARRLELRHSLFGRQFAEPARATADWRPPPRRSGTPSQSSASCSSSAFAGRATPRRAPARSPSASSRPRSAALSGSSQRRAITACVRRSSSGASSR